MKRIGILSDTHSCWDERYATHFGCCDEIWHAGDVGDIYIIERLNEIAPVVRAVHGNIDHGIVARKFPELLTFTVEGINVYMRHIGGYPGRYEQGVAENLVRRRINLMVTGHSHILKIMPDPRIGCLHINPGAAGTQGWQKQRTLVRLVIDGADMRDLEVIELGKLKI